MQMGYLKKTKKQNKTINGQSAYLIILQWPVLFGTYMLVLKFLMFLKK